MKQFIVTFKHLQHPTHDPHNKVTALCPVSMRCTDATGAHHSMLSKPEAGNTAEEVQQYYREFGLHVTRVEET